MCSSRFRSHRRLRQLETEKKPQAATAFAVPEIDSMGERAEQLRTVGLAALVIYINPELEQLRQFFTPKNEEKPEIHGGFVLAKWCGDPKTEEMLADMKITIRCIPTEQSGTKGRCILTGQEATLDAIFAKSY